LPADAVGTHGGWPRKCPIFGVEVSVTDYGEAARSILKAAREKVPAIVAHVNVHLLVAASDDRSLGNQLNSFDIAAPDGQPVRWALNHFHRTGLSDTVTGPDLMLILCREAAESGVCIYLYGGSSPEVVDRLIFNLRSLFPLLNIVGCESPPFRALTPKEGREVVERINSSGAGIVFIGLGAPKQERFAYEHRDGIKAVQVCVGAAFDYHSGVRKRVPKWFRKRGLEWLFRLVQDPRRLWLRYITTNSLFLWKIVLSVARRWEESRTSKR